MFCEPDLERHSRRVAIQIQPGIRTVALGLLLLIHSVVFIGRDAAADEQTLFACSFPTASLAKPWKTIGGTWQVQQGVLKRVDAGLDDPSKAVLVIGDVEEMSSGIEVIAKFRLESWSGDDQARAGVGLCCDPETGYGLNLAFNRGQLQFVHDYVTWAPGCVFSYQTGEWYWMKLCRMDGVLRGKAWRDANRNRATGWSRGRALTNRSPAARPCSRRFLVPQRRPLPLRLSPELPAVAACLQRWLPRRV